MSDQIPQWEDQFPEMQREWREMHQQKMASDTTRWEKQFAGMSDEYQCLVARGLWVSGPSDFFSIIERAEDERTHSRVLAWLLTPTGRHGLKNLLLEHLLEHYDAKHAQRGNACPRQCRPIALTVDRFKKYRNDNREADVVVWGEDFTLVIEMKVNAGEPPAQCDDLYKNFKGEPGSGQKAAFLFLTRDGGAPTTATGDAKRAFETISWPQVRCMIEAALNDPVSKEGTAVPIVENYVLTLKESFG